MRGKTAVKSFDTTPAFHSLFFGFFIVFVVVFWASVEWYFVHHQQQQDLNCFQQSSHRLPSSINIKRHFSLTAFLGLHKSWVWKSIHYAAQEPKTFVIVAGSFSLKVAMVCDPLTITWLWGTSVIVHDAHSSKLQTTPNDKAFDSHPIKYQWSVIHDNINAIWLDCWNALPGLSHSDAQISSAAPLRSCCKQYSK